MSSTPVPSVRNPNGTKECTRPSAPVHAPCPRGCTPCSDPSCPYQPHEHGLSCHPLLCAHASPPPPPPRPRGRSCCSHRCSGAGEQTACQWGKLVSSSWPLDLSTMAW